MMRVYKRVGWIAAGLGLILSGQSRAHVEYYDLNKAYRVVDRTDRGAGDVFSALPTPATGHDILVEGENGGEWTITPATVGSPRITSVTFRDVKRFAWIAGTNLEQGDSHRVNFFNFHLDQPSYVTIVVSEKDAGLNPAFTLYKGLLVYYGHDDAATDPLNPLDDTYNPIQSLPDSGTVTDGQAIVSPYRNTMTSSVSYIGQFNALNGWSQGRQDGDWWIAVQYLTHRNDNSGASETLERHPLAPGDYTIAVGGAACNDFAVNRACRDPLLAASLSFSAVPMCDQASSRPLWVNTLSGPLQLMARTKLRLPVQAVECGDGPVAIKLRGKPR